MIKTADTSKIIMNPFKNVSKRTFGAGINLTNNEIKDFMKVIKSLEKRGMLLKETTRKIFSQEGGFLIFFRLLMTVVLPLMKSVLTPLGQNFLLPFQLFQRKFMDQVVLGT